MSLTSYSREKRYKFAGLESCCCSPLHHTLRSAPQMFCSHVHPLPQSKRAARCAGTYWDSQSNSAYRSPETGMIYVHNDPLFKISICKCVLKGLKQVSTMWRMVYTYIRHGQRLLKSNLHFINNGYTKWQHSHKHSNL